MGGIVGLWNRDGRPADATVLCRMRERLSHRRGVDSFAVSGAASTGLTVAFDGRLDNRDELADLVEKRTGATQFVADGSLVAAAYRAFGEDAVARLAGDFAVAIFDPARHTLLLARDALGVRPLYYYADARVCLFASEIKAIVAHPGVETRPNDAVVADYLFNLLAADDPRGETFFTNIFGVLPSHVVRVTAEQTSTRRYWDFDPGRRLAITSAEEAAEGFADHFTRAVRRRLRSPGRVAVSVSGGLDSSAIFCVAHRLGRGAATGLLREPRPTGASAPVLGVSYTVPDGYASDEKAFLVDLERHCGVTIDRLTDLPSGLVDGSSEGVWHLEAPMLEARWTGTVAYYAAIRDRGAATLLTGHWGDQFLVDPGFFVDLLRAGRWPMAWRSFVTYRRWRDEGVGDAGKAIVRAAAREALPRRLADAARRLRDRRRSGHELDPWYTAAFRQRGAEARRRRPAETRVGSVHARRLYRTARSRYYVLGMEWQNKLAAMFGLDVAFPFLDRDLIAYLMALPGELVAPGGVPKGILRRALRGTLPAAIAERPSKADFSHDVNAAAAADYDRLVARLRAGGQAVAFGYARSDALRDIDRFRPSPGADTCTLSWALTDRLSLELWLAAYFGSSTEAAHHA